MTTPSAPAALDTRREKERAKYVALAAKSGSTYGSTNHGKLAVPIIQKFKPRFVVDFAFPDADLVRPMHSTALHAGVADVVTSFDALEHLLPEDVDAVLAEMRRVAKPRGYFVLSISTRPSKTTVAGEGLHPTVRPLDWWLDRIGRVGTVTNPRAERRFIVGRFQSDGGCCGA